MTHFVKKRGTRYGLVLLVIGAAGTTAAWTRDVDSDSARGPDADADAEVAEVPKAASSEMATLLFRVDLDGEALAAAGVQSSSVAALVAAIEAHVAEHPGSIVAADAAWADARRSEDDLGRLVRSGRGTPEDAQAYQTAKQALESTKAARQAALDAAFAAGTSAAPQAQREALSTIRANRSWRLPAAYLAANRSEREWVDLGDALACERILEKQGGDPLDAEVSQLLAAAKGAAAVADALYSVDTKLASVQTAWNQAVIE